MTEWPNPRDTIMMKDPAASSKFRPYHQWQRKLEMELISRFNSSTLQPGDRELILGFQKIYDYSNEYEMQKFGFVRTKEDIEAKYGTKTEVNSKNKGKKRRSDGTFK